MVSVLVLSIFHFLMLQWGAHQRIVLFIKIGCLLVVYWSYNTDTTLWKKNNFAIIITSHSNPSVTYFSSLCGIYHHKIQTIIDPNHWSKSSINIIDLNHPTMFQDSSLQSWSSWISTGCKHRSTNCYYASCHCSYCLLQGWLLLQLECKVKPNFLQLYLLQLFIC